MFFVCWVEVFRVERLGDVSEHVLEGLGPSTYTSLVGDVGCEEPVGDRIHNAVVISQGPSTLRIISHLDT